MGKGLVNPANSYSTGKVNAMKIRNATPLAIYSCPTRRNAVPYRSVTTWGKPSGAYPFSGFDARCDYAANQGDSYPIEHNSWPQTLASGWSGWAWSQDGSPAKSSFTMTGINFMNAWIGPKDVPDGMSHTYMIGEKYLNPDAYFDGSDGADDWSMYSGAQNDINRLCVNDKDGYSMPARDRKGYSNQYAFGSAHSDSFNMVMCDGSAHSVAYGIDMELHRRLGNRKDKLPVEMDKIYKDATP
jgi:prepilin-type processing-associated H-X9-DG protein